MSLLNEDLIGSFSQCISVFIREGSIASFNKIMVEGSTGVFWGAYGHLGELQVVDGVGGDRGGDGILLPLLIGLADQNPSNNKATTDSKEPEDLCSFGLKIEVFKLKSESEQEHNLPLLKKYR